MNERVPGARLPSLQMAHSGQVGKNDNNFHIEDFQTSIMHIITGLFKKYINDKIKKRI